jgi:dihydrolipoamide dehydrogenase
VSRGWSAGVHRIASEGGINVADSYDLIVIGAGPGGYVAAIRAAQLGMSVAVVEMRPTLGGTCLNVGCIPSKALLDSSELFHVAQTGMERQGIKLSGVALDLPVMLGRKDRIVRELTDGIRFLFKKNRITGITGRARLAGPGRVEVALNDGGTASLSARHIVLATGSEPVELPFLKFDGRVVVSSTEALAFDRVPEHLVVVGGGFIGLELGSVWRRLGSKVTVIEFLPKIVPLMDDELGKFLLRSLQKQGIEFHLQTKVTGAVVENDQAVVTATGADGQPLSFGCDRILVSVGRRGYLDGLGLDQAGVKHDPKAGKITVDSHFRTNVEGVYAIGDIIAGPMLAHKAEDEGVAVAELLAGKAGHVNYDVIPSVVYTHPEAASVGLSEEQLKEQNRPYRIGKSSFAPNARAKAMEQAEGFVKILADPQTDRVLGVHIIGPHASELIEAATVVLEFGGASEDLARTCHAHPTLSEVVREAAMAVEKWAIHGA